jgi:ornithine cyclodeaminase/alanine dehydrogenase-like protein (mu-crystallin family)
METTMAALEEAYLALAAREAVCRPRIDIRIPTSDPAKNYQWGTMEGGSTAGYFAIRMKSDVVYETQYNGSITQEKYCTRPGLYCGLILLTSIETGEPLAFINDGHLQHMRVGADGGIGVKYLANEDAAVVGMLGTGGMARTHMRAFTLVRNIKKLQVFSPTRENREKFGREMAAAYNIEVVVCDRPEEIYAGADIVAGLTDSAVPVIDGTLLEPGAHIVNVGGSGKPDAESLRRVDVYLRFGDAPAPVGKPELGVDDEYLGWEARPDQPKFGDGRRDSRRRGNALPEKRVTLADLVAGKVAGRSSRDQITYSERGNLQGVQFFAVAGKIYELAKRNGLGREIPTEWFLQDIRD